MGHSEITMRIPTYDEWTGGDDLTKITFRGSGLIGQMLRVGSNAKALTKVCILCVDFVCVYVPQPPNIWMIILYIMCV